LPSVISRLAAIMGFATYAENTSPIRARAEVVWTPQLRRKERSPPSAHEYVDYGQCARRGWAASRRVNRRKGMPWSRVTK
jgi:hypothetical protein